MSHNQNREEEEDGAASQMEDYPEEESRILTGTGRMMAPSRTNGYPKRKARFSWEPYVTYLDRDASWK
jgi:hypothetical protein